MPIMSQTVRKILSISLALAYFVSASFVEIGHGHTSLAPPTSTQQIQSHDCGAHEQHKPLGTVKHCALCQQILQFASTLVEDFTTIAIHSYRISFPHSLLPQFPELCLLQPTRGPPSLL